MTSNYLNRIYIIVFINNKIGNKIVYVKYIILKTKRHYDLNVKMLNYCIYSIININELISEIIIACRMLFINYDNSDYL